ncbi:MAG: penicillin-insensitive murein endopeptidase [Syntrophobacteraceae bacterium]|nr:penicillin-insensitive murein endopeptidase [Syntrophobacteraceae bacterium]
MGRFNSLSGLNFVWISFISIILPSIFFVNPIQALTASYGQPYNGRLVNGVPFPKQFPGYQIRGEDQTHTTPEVVGAMLDAIEAVRNYFPNTADLYIGDFSNPTGGPMRNHRSHQNGRDVDLGMYAKDNRTLDGFIPMNEENLDVAKTWCLLENIIRSQRVQYVFLDRRIQKLLYDYAAARGTDPAYLDRLFGNDRGSFVRHVRNHVDHMHIRFFTPWSTLAAHIGDHEDQKRMVIDMAQQAYLPKKVHYYVKGSERSLDTLASSFGVSRRDLCRWNQITGTHPLTPGSCLVFYKRGFEMEPVRLAQSLQPGLIVETPPVKVAALRSTDTLSDAPIIIRETSSRERRSSSASSAPAYGTYKAKKGDTPSRIAKLHNMDVKTFCRLNNIKESNTLKPGQTFRVAAARQVPTARDLRSGDLKPSQDQAVSAPRKSGGSTTATYTVKSGDTIQKIAKATGISSDKLIRMNGLKQGDALKPGRQMMLASTEPPPGASVGTTRSNASSPKLPASGTSSATAVSSAATKGKTTSTQAKSTVASKAPASPASTRTVSKSSASSKTTEPAVKSSKPASVRQAPQPVSSKSPVAAPKPAVPASDTRKKEAEGKRVAKDPAAGKVKTQSTNASASRESPSRSTTGKKGS